MYTTPLLNNDYLTAETIAKTLSIAQPASYVTTKTSFKPELSGSYVTVKPGTAWIGGTLVESTELERISVEAGAPDSSKKLLVLRVYFDGETQPELKIVPHSYYPNSSPTGWSKVLGEQVDFPIALVEKEYYWWKITDTRVFAEAAVFRYMGDPEMPEVYAAPVGTFYTGTDGELYCQNFEGGRKVTPPDSPDVFRQFSSSVNDKNAYLDTDTSRLNYTQSNATVHVVGQIPATREPLKAFFPIEGMPDVLAIGHMGSGRPVVARKQSDGNWAIETNEGLIPALDINVDFQIIGKVDRNA